MVMDTVPIAVVFVVACRSLTDPYTTSDGTSASASPDHISHLNQTTPLSHDFVTALEVLSIFLLWSKAFYFLRIWTETAYIAKMVVQVGYDMKVFLLITAIAHCGLG
jgi:hypothetical protein